MSAADTTFRRPIAWRSAALSDVGCVREVNEDSLFADDEGQLWAVADGMGGHRVGDIASQKIVALLSAVVPGGQLSDYLDRVEDALLTANHTLMEFARQAFDNQTMGSTVVCLLIKQHVGLCLWVGDSRLYRYRNHQLQRLSRDHSQVEEMLQMGLLTAEEAEHHPHKNVITRAVGVEEEVYVDLNVFSTQVGDTFLLCSDGLYNAVPAARIGEMLAPREPERCAAALIQAALDNGAEDNVSVVVVKGEPGTIA